MQLLFWAGCALLFPQALWVRRRGARFMDAAGEPEGRVAGPEPVRLLAIGDSIIAGVGCRTLARACVGQTALQLAERLGRGVTWRSLGQTGATTGDIFHRLVPELPEESVEFVLISAGVNDMTGLKTIPEWCDRLACLMEAVHRHSPHARVVMLGIPPMGCFPRLPQPLRALFGLRARGFDRAAAQRLESIPYAVYAPFERKLQPDEFAPDGYHPSEESCTRMAGLLADALVS